MMFSMRNYILTRAVKRHVRKGLEIDEQNSRYSLYEGPYYYTMTFHNEADAHRRAARRINKLLR